MTLFLFTLNAGLAAFNAALFAATDNAASLGASIFSGIVAVYFAIEAAA